MDYIKVSSTQAAGQFNFSQSHNQSKVIKLLLSVSVLSILLSYSSLVSFLLHSFNAFTSAAPVKLFSYSFDKNYMFLLCNGLLVFIVKNSGLIGTSPPGSTNLNNDEHAPKNSENPQRVVELAETKAPKAKEEVVNMEVEEEQEREDDEIFITVEEEEEEDKRVLITQAEEEEGCRNSSIMVEDHDAYEEEGIESLSREELNKKCDDFIRRMKEGIKLEVQQAVMF
ncbi:PREDICTED: uncharacterized protein LOC103329252 [Prunus mume]|uniref:Uncharacterized protein LOC103329252 n=1 Tax=Prunus mume TaxID=102107 RepID=A0ABM0NU89_PRUMU|nr:PREDICTED: uncharacterized protein LOC103329252 [Prunus mume]